MIVRRAAPAEVIDVRHAVLRAGRARETAIFAGDDDPATRHWVAVHGDRVVGVVTVIPAPWPAGDPPWDGLVWQLRGMGVLAELRGRHVGEALLQATHAEVAAPTWCNARAEVEGFYARSGWVTVGAAFEIPPIGPHVRMAWRP